MVGERLTNLSATIKGHYFKACGGTMDFSKEIADRRIQKVLSIINVSSTPASVAQSVNLSASWLEHLFKAETGTPLRIYLITKRLERAANLLVDTEMPVKEVAYCVGYGHPSSFVRAFIKHFGTTPKLFRGHNSRKCQRKAANAN